MSASLTPTLDLVGK
jgi:hypothetical protein